METLKDIFVPYEIAQKLKEIGFDEPCMTGYFNGNLHIDFKKKTNAQTIDLEEIDFSDFNNWENHYSAPTWEQVKKWFREKNYQSSIVFNLGSFYGYIEHTIKVEAFTTDKDYTSYEQAREQLILKLIEIYKNEQDI